MIKHILYTKGRSCLVDSRYKSRGKIQNFKNSKPLDLSKYKKYDQIWTKKISLDQRL